MSLVGNLGDLSLGDIMQIISLSQKSGVLALDGDEGSGRIVFRAGLVQAASVKGQPEDLRGVLVGAGLIEAPVFDELAARASEFGLAIDETLAREGSLESEQITQVIHDSVEAAILEMFSWESGDFSFDVRSDAEPDDPQLILTTGINAQYLAMEGMRINDERSRDESASQEIPADEAECDADSPGTFPSTDNMFGDEPLETEAFAFDDESDLGALEIEADLSATDSLVASVVSREDSDPAPAPVESASPAPPSDRETAKVQTTGPAPAAISATSGMTLILIDPETSVVEWVKHAMKDHFARIHVFQQAEQGLARIRQYMIRGELPVVLISTEVRVDPLSGIHGLSDFVSRLKTQASKLVVIALRAEAAESAARLPAAFDGVLIRPTAGQLAGRRDGEPLMPPSSLVSGLHEILAKRATPPARPATSANSTSLRELRDATAKLNKASSRGEILPLVLSFASDLLARVAILIVRDDHVFAVAGRGFDVLDVDPLDSKKPVSLQTLDAGWIRRVIDTGEPYQGPPSTPADRDLIEQFGGEAAATSYLGPIESGGSTIALLYGDQGPGGPAIPDTSGLEVVLHHAGLALDRAALERALWEADASGQAPKV